MSDILMLGALFLLRVVVPLLFIVGLGYLILGKLTGAKFDFSPKFLLVTGGVFTLWALGAIILLLRFAYGLGRVTNLNDQFPLGLWIGFDVMAGAMLGGGAFVLCGLVYVFGLEEFRPIVRSTVLTAFLGYALLVVALIIDIGRPYNIYMPLLYWNPHSVLWEVALCVMTYTTVLALEFLPAVFERLRWKRAWRIMHAVTVPLVIVGICLSTMHQSSLGSLWLIAPGKLNDLWFTPLLPVLFWISAITVGLGMVVVESNLSSRGFKRGLEQHLLMKLSKGNSVLLAFYVLVKLGDLAVRGHMGLLFQANLQAVLFWLELGVGALIPAILMASPRVRANANQLLGAGALVVAGGILNRLNVSVFGLWSYTGPVYMPSWSEVVLTLALLSVGVAIFAVSVKYLPVFPEEEKAGAHGQHAVLVPSD
jgi:Ni/Fe-hydrogenase subunit HybB-like protein